MADAPKKLWQGLVPATPATFYTVPSNVAAVIFERGISLVNNHATLPVTVKLYRNGLDDAHRVRAPIVIPAGQAADEGGFSLNVGETLGWSADVDAVVTGCIDGLEVS